MVQISVKKDELVIEINNCVELLSKYQYIMRFWGFNLSCDKRRFTLKDRSRIKEIFEDVIDFFTDKKVSFQSTQELVNYSNYVQIEKEKFENAKRFGEICKDNEIPGIVNIPDFKTRKLFSYQEDAVKFMLGVENHANFGIPGCGKTTIEYAIYSILKKEKKVEKILVIGRHSCFDAWETEYQECFGEKGNIIRLVGNQRANKYSEISTADVILTTYQTGANDSDKIIDILKKYKTFMIIDESHYIKALRGEWAAEMLRLAPYATVRAICSGTPMPNGLIDLYTQMTFLWPNYELLGSIDEYRDILGNYNADTVIKKMIYPFFYRIKQQQLDLPERKEERVYVEMPRYQREIYKLLAEDIIKELVKLSTIDRLFISQWKKNKIMLLMQLASNPLLLSKYCGEYGKQVGVITENRIVEIIKNYYDYEKPVKILKAVEIAKGLIDKGEKVIIWVNFIKSIFLLKQELEDNGITIFCVYGGVPKNSEDNIDFNREQQIKDFKMMSSACILIANPAACAESVSLHQYCHNAIYLERSFNCAHDLQSRDRIYRAGLKKDILTKYFIIICKDTIEEVIDERLKEKERKMSQVIDQDLPILDLENDEENTDLNKEFKLVIEHLKNRFC